MSALAKSVSVSTPAQARAMLAGVEYVLLDVDGVLVSGSRVIPGVPEALAELRRAGMKLRVVTNNSTRPIANLVKHFADLGMQFAPHEVISSSAATAYYLKTLAPTKPLEHGNVFVLGSAGLAQDLRSAMPPQCKLYGPQLHAGTAHKFGELLRTCNHSAIAQAIHTPALPPFEEGGPDESIESLNVACVVVGLDPEFSLAKLTIANLLLRQRKDCLFVATNTDPQYSVSHNMPCGNMGTALMPGGGTIVHSLAVAVGRQPDVEIGKPFRYLFDIIAGRDARPGESAAEFAKRCLMVGDRLTTDVQFGKTVGARTLFVLTGCETEANIAETGIVPDYTAAGLGSIGTMLSAASSKL